MVTEDPFVLLYAHRQYPVVLSRVDRKRTVMLVHVIVLVIEYRARSIEHEYDDDDAATIWFQHDRVFLADMSTA